MLITTRYLLFIPIAEHIVKIYYTLFWSEEWISDGNCPFVFIKTNTQMDFKCEYMYLCMRLLITMCLHKHHAYLSTLTLIMESQLPTHYSGIIIAPVPISYDSSPNSITTQLNSSFAIATAIYQSYTTISAIDIHFLLSTGQSVHMGNIIHEQH